MWNNNNPLPVGDPKKIVKYALAIGAGLLVLWIFVLAQTDSRDRSFSVEEQQRIDSLRVALGRDIQPIQESERTRMLPNAITTILILGGTILVFWFYFQKKSPPSSPSNPVFNVLSRQSLPGGQEIQVIEINDEYWVLGITHQQVNLLHRYKKEEWDLIVKDEMTDNDTKSFASLLSNFQKK